MVANILLNKEPSSVSGEVPNVLSTRNARSALFVLFLSYVLFCWWAFTPMMLALHSHWTTANDLDAGYMLLVVVLYILWQVADEQPQRTSEKHDAVLRYVCFVGFALCIVAASLATITANKSATLALLVAGFAPLCVWVMGVRLLSSAVHVSAILLMATPIWFVLVPQLQSLTATAVNWLLSRGNWPIYIEGNLIALPQGLLEIAAGCAGLKFLQTALALTLIEGFVARRGWRAMAIIGMVCVALAIVSNWLRVSAITLMALKLDPSHPWVADHNWVGWLLFAIMFGPLFYWLGRIELFAKRPSSTPFIPLSSQRGVGSASLGSRAIVALVIAFGGVYALANAAHGDASARIGVAQVAAVRARCQTNTATRAPNLMASAARFPGAQLVVDCLTPSGYQLSLRGYLQEAQAKEVVNPINELLPGLGLLEYRVTSQQDASRSSAPALLTVDDTVTVAYGFYATGQWCANARDFKLRSLLRPFVAGPVYALVLVDAQASHSQKSRGEERRKKLEEEYVEVAEALRLAE